ncbi:Putative disease resistance RPP13-like protein 1 [Apostasia shenzhenica]|uniref:Disease resistance RPP13-like protein 1 n=1 Tax=Apostasia shenzhenica TaxID=1088818 RepID=A0A2I0ANG3_9ASPA|nr:Putative disease resistance RPP13-like protein 1 [Apostasia shenzhenica]
MLEMTVIGWFASAVISKLISTAFDYIADKHKQEGTQAQLEILQNALPEIEAVAALAESAQIDEFDPQLKPLKAWLRKMKDAVYEAENVIDVIEYLQMEKANKQNKFMVRFVASSFKKGILNSDPTTLDKLKGVVKKLKDAAEDVGPFLRLLSLTSEQIHQRERKSGNTSNQESGQIGSRVVGRDDLKEEMLGWLRSSSTNNKHSESFYMNVTVISVVGLGGMGKTTLARFVYDDIKKDDFVLKIWVYVGNNFDVKIITSKILEDITKEKPKSDALHLLQEDLAKKLKSKKFLLVLDDVWSDDNIIEWEKLFAPLKHGHLGSKVFLTTRMASVAEIAAKVAGEKMKSIELKGLEEGAYLSLFNQYAFNNIDINQEKKLMSIGSKIARKLGGNPLAAKTIGMALNSNRNDDHWEKILHNDIWRCNQGKQGITSALQLSYKCLPLHLKCCFAYCSIFPRGHQFSKDDVVYMWIASGFIHQSHDNIGNTLEDIGRMYFDDLVKKSFFEVDHRNFSMHDLIYELAQSISYDECLRIIDVGSVCKLNTTVRHLCVEAENLDVVKELLKHGSSSSLRTMLFYYNGAEDELEQVLPDFLKAIKTVRVLCISAKNMKILPYEVGELKHLRYLELKYAKIIQLPASICKLYHLEFFIYSSDFGLPSSFSESCHLQCFIKSIKYISFDHNFFPRCMSSLTKIRHIIFPYWDLIEPIVGIGRLTRLQEFPRLKMSMNKSYCFKDMKDMVELRKLQIHCLDNVNDPKEAIEAKLDEKCNLNILLLHWRRSNTINHTEAKSAEELLDSLQPHSNLKKLELENYRGTRCSSWMQPPRLCNLESISLNYCLNLEQIPTVGQLPFLKRLILSEMPMLKQLGNEFHGDEKHSIFPSLVELEISSMEALELWSTYPTTEFAEWFPCLHRLKISNCPRLKQLPPLPPSLVKLSIFQVGLEHPLTLWQGHTTSGIISSSLEFINLYKLESLGRLYEGITDFDQNFACLRHLIVKKCSTLTELPPLPLTIKYLTIDKAGLTNFTLITSSSIGTLNSSPDEIKIEGYPNITCLPPVDVLKQFTSLQSLYFNNCEVLMSLEGLHSIHSLKHLQISRCPNITRGEVPVTVENLSIDDPSLLLRASLRNLRCLHKLQVSYNVKLTSFPDYFESWIVENHKSLQHLGFYYLKSLEELPSCLNRLTSLKSLELRSVSQLHVLPDLPSSLQRLWIRSSSAELEEHYKNGGVHWPKIAHIPSCAITAGRLQTMCVRDVSFC